MRALRRVGIGLIVMLGLWCAPARAQGDVDVTGIYWWSGIGGTQRFKMSTGSGAPSGGTTGDWYLDYATGEVYTRRNTGSWTLLIRAEDTNTFIALQTFSAGITGASHTLEQFNGTNPQRFNIYNTRTSATNNEYGYLWWNSNFFRLGTDAGSGGGTDRDILIEPGNATALTLAAGTLKGTFAGAVSVGGNFDVGTTKFTVVASTGVTTINGNAAALPAPITGTQMHIGGPDSTNFRLELDAFNGNGILELRRANGTAASPSAVAADNILGTLNASAYGATGYSVGARARIDFGAGQTWTDSAQGTFIGFRTTPNGSTTLAEKVRIHGSGGVSIGTPTTDPGTNVLGVTEKILPFQNYHSDIGSFTARFLSLYAAELWVQTLVAQETIATIGGRVLVAPTNTLTADLAPAATQIQVKYNNFVNGDRVYMEAAGQVEWMAIASGVSGSAGAYLYSVTRNLDGSGANTWVAGDAIVSTGTIGSGYLDIFSVAGVLGTGSGPTIVGNVRTGTTYNQVAPRWAAGNLKSIYNYSASDIYGACFGDATATHICIDATNGLRIRNSTTNKLVADTSGNLTLTGDLIMSTSGVFRAGATAFTTTTGWWMDYNGGTPRFRIGNPSGQRASWDGTNLTIVSDTLTVDTNGVAVTPAASSQTDKNGYRFTVSGSSDLGMYGVNDDSTSRRLYLYSNGLNASATANLISISTVATTGISITSGTAASSSAISLQARTLNMQGDPGNQAALSVAANFTITDASGGSNVLTIQPGTGASAFFGTTSGGAVEYITNNTTVLKMFSGGGVTIGTPTGGDKGSGALNAVAVYDDNVLLTDWVFDLAYGQRQPVPATWPSTSRRLYTLAEVRAVTENERRLPWMPKAAEFEQERGLGKMLTRLYQGQEQQQLYFFDLEARIAALEQAAARRH